jgi:hypothetical protein
MSTATPAPAEGEPGPGAGPEAVCIPGELAQVPAGAVLAGVLEDIEIEQVCGFDAVEVMCAEFRLWCRQTARFYRAVLETGLRRPFSIDTVERVSTLGEFAAEEARAALVWSRSRAEATIGFGFEIFERLPVLGEAMLAGLLDEPRARALVEWTDGLDAERAHAVCQQLVPTAGTVTVGELIERIKRACLAIDPDWAEKKYRAAVSTRRVRGFLGPDGTGTLTGQCQPAERVIAACERIDALARACKRAGDGRAIDHIRSDLFLGMTDGTLEGLTEPEIITHVLAHPYTVPGDHTNGDTNQHPEGRGNPGGTNSPDHDSPDGDSTGGSGNGGPGGGPGGGGPGGGGPGDGGGGFGAGGRGPAGSSGSGVSRPDRSTEPTEPAAPAEPAEPVIPTRPPGPAALPEPVTRAESADPPESAKPPAPAEPAAPAEPPESAPRAGGGSARGWSVPELRVQLGTLLGLNGEPGEMPGWGYVPAWLARHLVARMAGAEWRYALCNTDGQVIDGGLITTRPATPEGARVRRGARRGGIVEIALRPGDPTRLINTPATGPAARPAIGPTASPATGPAARPATGPAARPAGPAGEVGSWAPVLAELAQAVKEPGSTRQPGTAEAARRTPGAVLRRWIQQRDRRCVHPCCRVPASKADQDHRIGYAHGGPTTEANLSTPCRHDHRLKDQGHWRITTPQPALTIWTSPLGHHYQSRPPPAIPRPATPPPVQARTHQTGFEPPGRPTSQPDTCGCMLTPCPHDQQTAVTITDNAEHIADTEPRKPDLAAPEPDILDNAEPPF